MDNESHLEDHAIIEKKGKKQAKGRPAFLNDKSVLVKTNPLFSVEQRLS
jgi:hypothetical protein